MTVSGSSAPERPRGGRPRSFDVDEVLTGAVELFWRDGFAATTARRLQEQLGISQSSLYHAFGSKDGLQLAALDAYEAATADALIVPLEQADDPRAGLVVFLEGLAAWVTGDGKAGCMVINLMADEPDRFADRTAAYRARVRAAIRGALARTDVADVEQVTDLVFGQVLAINVLARTRDHEAVGRQLQACLALVEDVTGP